MTFAFCMVERTRIEPNNPQLFDLIEINSELGKMPPNWLPSRDLYVLFTMVERVGIEPTDGSTYDNPHSSS